MDKLKEACVIFVIILMALSIISVSGYCILNDSLMELKNEKQQLTDDFNEIQFELKETKSELRETEHRLDENISELKKLQSGNRYEMHDPTYQEVADFIRNDKTDERTPIEDTFVCRHFAQLVNNNAEDQGIRCAFVVLGFGSKSSHAIVGFDTVDYGIVYIEPQSDEWVRNLEIGKEYWTECVIPKYGHYADCQNDTIKEISIYW